MLSGCSISSSKDYHVDACHFVDKDQVFTCSTEPIGLCTTELRYTDICGRYVSCTENGEVEIDQEMYNACIDCFKGGNICENSHLFQ